MAWYNEATLFLCVIMLLLMVDDAQCNRQKRATGAVPHSLQKNMDAQISRTEAVGNDTQQLISILATQTQQIDHLVSSSTQLVGILEAQSERINNLTSVVGSMAALLAHCTAAVQSMAALFPVLIKGFRLAAGDCSDIAAQGPYTSGVYTITPWDDWGSDGSFKVYCEMTADNAGWTVFQKRINGSVAFYRGWDEYKNGFGDLSGEFWIGLAKLNQLTSTRVSWQLKVELWDFEGNTAYALYDNFRIGDESTQFQLSIGTYSGTAGDSLSYHNGMKFTTKDRDNDLDVGNCAVIRTGAWWYQACDYSNLNGPYLQSAQQNDDSVNWYHWKSAHIALKKAEMKIKPIVI